MTSAIKQPLHPSVIPRLDPEYVAFHNSVIAYLDPPSTAAWDPAIRLRPTVPGGSAPLAVGKTQDFELTHTKVRTFTPEGNPPSGGWPVFIFFHGGGWTLGGISAETSFSTNMCVHAQCVVVSVDYRLAPENPYPAAVDDAVESLHWVLKNGESSLSANTKKIAVGGSSSGGNLSAILALKAAESTPPIPLVFQLLIVPVIDNTASVSTSWAENQHTPWLTPARMMWFRGLDKVGCLAIVRAPRITANVPKAWIAVAELDILRDEGVKYGEKLREQGVEVEIEIYRGGPHPIMAMDALFKSGGISSPMPLLRWVGLSATRQRLETSLLWIYK
ncbi:alpha/beta hydrolase fold-domain-containing protein [Infundibulicybe gibba]|nr:alpha/beta hydrolase fold-domain-containing protein [Infundibulicybe gibba]